MFVFRSLFLLSCLTWWIHHARQKSLRSNLLHRDPSKKKWTPRQLPSGSIVDSLVEIPPLPHATATTLPLNGKMTSPGLHCIMLACLLPFNLVVAWSSKNSNPEPCMQLFLYIYIYHYNSIIYLYIFCLIHVLKTYIQILYIVFSFCNKRKRRLVQLSEPRHPIDDKNVAIPNL